MATGSRELDVLSPRHLVEGVDALLLTGGSAFGLDAAQGVMAWLEERGQGFDAGVARIPLVPAAVIFDLTEDGYRPGPEEGRAACDDASTDPVVEGRVGAGAGATVGKFLGPQGATPGGIGTASRAVGEHRVGALAVVNALGDVVGPGGDVLAGARGPDGAFVGTDDYLQGGGGPAGFGDAAGGEGRGEKEGPAPGTNTTLVVVGTDMPLSRMDLQRLAGIASGAFPRAISPVNTPFDGDILFALSVGLDPKPVSPGELLALGVVARGVVEEAIRRGVTWSSGIGDVDE